ncbi:hypothetical protein Hypma_013158 [Hypsizygus marmoreus]|uniref:Uncharacterized protein n=1 Tax=Hypsizygus marmoreus TaxID=39966 RepID=A0A369JCA8_HYPMA|nr:hypothetical protein Hypma_013158 [Hypsizygus marmoreus]
MLDFLSRWLPWAESTQGTDDDSKQGLPLPATSKSKWKDRELQLVTTSAISSPIPRLSPPAHITGFEVADRGQQYPYPHPSPNTARAGPSNVAWISSSDNVDEQAYPSTLPPAAVIRLPSQSHIHPIGRSVSSPPTSPSYISSSSSSSPFSSPSPPKWNLKLNTNASFSQSTHSLRLDPRPYTTTSTDVYGYSYNYPLAKQLSPIAEQDYFSPDSLRKTIRLPSVNGSTPSVAHSLSNATNPSPGGSQNSEITRPSPSYSNSHPFITRHLNRTISQTSSRTHISTSSSIPRLSTQSSAPPSIPPLNLAPPFPGPHPSQNGTGPPLRPRRSTIVAMPTIIGSSESGGYLDDDDEAYGGEDDLESLHAESFVTASDALPVADGEMDIADASSSHTTPQKSARSGGFPVPSISAPPSVRSAAEGSRLPSTSESFIGRRWERDAALGSGVVTFRAKRQWLSYTPAFWAFWLGFVCPVLWLIGGWHFTRFGEQPPRLTFWEFYCFGRWRNWCCLWKRRRVIKGLPGNGDGVSSSTGGRLTMEQQLQQARLPKWVTEKQSSDDGRLRLHDPKRSLRGISFGYPFIPRPVSVQRQSGDSEVWCMSATKHIVDTLEKPNRLFDQLYGIKLKEVRGRPESGRRIFDPWIQRCRYAFCYALILLAVGLCSASTYLIIYNTRQLR